MNTAKPRRTIKHSTDPSFTRLTVVVDSEVVACLREIAFREERSLSQVARRLLRQALGIAPAEEGKA